MPELSRRLKWQRRWDDHQEVIGHTIAYLAFAAFLVGLILHVLFDVWLGWAWWLFVPVVIGAVIATFGDGAGHRFPEEGAPHP
jgi:fatty-acid desaturase